MICFSVDWLARFCSRFARLGKTLYSNKSSSLCKGITTGNSRMSSADTPFWVPSGPLALGTWSLQTRGYNIQWKKEENTISLWLNNTDSVDQKAIFRVL